MSVTAALLSATVDAIISSSITAATLGIGLAAAKTLGSIAGTMTYVAVYTLMTKFSIDRKLHEAESEERSNTFYPASSAKVEPVSLNEKCLYDRVLQDTMAAALLAHPGGYYQTVSGGVSGDSYTGHLVVSPPNLVRVFNSFGGFTDLLWENFWNAGESDPDAYTALDFDDLNLDYLLTTSELPFYNTKPYYTYHNTEFIFDTYNMYSYNTLGSLETQVLEGSSGQFDAIRPTCVDGAPQYEFINSADYSRVLPQQILYKPVVLSQTRYNQTQPALGRLTVEVQCKDYDKTLGINPYNMNEIEQTVYEAKVPLNDNGFEYPIRYIYIDVVNYDIFEGTSYFAQNLLVNESYYAIDCGNLYFTKSLEAIILEKYSGFEEYLSQTWASKIIKSTTYYNVRVVFDRFVPDTTDETNSLALAQATSYAIMDYFNQYTYAEISGNMISEIAYTETMTFWSTLISAPLAYFGSWAVKGTDAMMSKASAELIKQGLKTKGQVINRMILKGIAGIALSPIMEVFQEIIEDGFKEALAENLVDIAGWTDDVGFWISSYWTAGREATGALGQLSLGTTANLQNSISLIYAVVSGDTDARLEIQQRIAQDLKAKHDAEAAKLAQMGFLDKLIKTDFLKGLFMVIPSVLFGSFSFVALSGLKKMITSSIKLSPGAYAEYSSLKHNGRKRLVGKAIGGQATDSESNKVLEQTKKPAGLDNAHSKLNSEFEGKSLPMTSNCISINPDPRTESRKDLADKFNTLSFEDMFKGWVETVYEDKRFASVKEIIKETERNYRILGYQETEKQILGAMKTAIKNLGGELAPADQRFFDMWGTSYLDPHIILCGIPKSSVKRGNFEIKEYDIIGTKASKSAMLTHLQEEYGIGPGMSLDMFALQGDVMAKIPDGTPNVDKWIIDSGLNPATTKVVIVPSTLVNPESDVLAGKGLFNKPKNFQGSSPYWPFFSKFRTDLQDILLRNSIIQDSKLPSISKMVSNAKYDVLGHYQSLLKTGEMFDFSEEDNRFDKWLAEIKYNLNDLKSKGEINENEYRTASLEASNLFEKMYSIFGLEKSNSYYHKVKIDLNKIFIVLRESGAITDSKLSNFLDYIGRAPTGYSGTLGASNDVPSLARLKGLKDALIESLEKDKTLSLKSKREAIKDCGYILDACIWRTKQYNKLNDELIILLDGKEDTMKARLIKLIASTHDVLLGLDTFIELSQLLFRGDSERQDYLINNFIDDNEEHIDEGGDLRILLRIQYSVNTWTCKDFDNNINNKELDALKTRIISIVDKFIEMPASNMFYRGDGSEKAFKTYTDDFIKDKYIIIRSFWMAYALFTENPKLSFKDIRRDSAVTVDLQVYLGKSSYKCRFGKNTINTLLSTIEMMYQIELFNIRDRGSMLGSYDKLLAYGEALDDIYKYIGVYYLGYSKELVQDKNNLEGLINDIREYFVGQHESIQSNPQKVHIKKSLKSLLRYPDLVKHLKRVKILKGYPKSVLEVYSSITRISSFNRRLVGFASKFMQNIKAKFIDKTIADKLFTEYKYGEGLVPDFLKDLFKNSQGSGKGASGSISHEVLAKRMRESQYYIGSEVPIWISLEDDHYAGHIDLLLYDAKTNTIYVCDYKPDLSMGDRGYYSFINSVPQIAAYGLLLQKHGDLKVKNVIFNNKEAWVFDPDNVLDPINEFMTENINGWYPPWEAFSRYL